MCKRAILQQIQFEICENNKRHNKTKMNIWLFQTAHPSCTVTLTHIIWTNGFRMPCYCDVNRCHIERVFTVLLRKIDYSCKHLFIMWMWSGKIRGVITGTSDSISHSNYGLSYTKHTRDETICFFGNQKYLSFLLGIKKKYR